MVYVVKERVKMFLNLKMKIRVSPDTYDELDAQVENMLKKACQRVRENGRKTVMPMDL